VIRRRRRPSVRAVCVGTAAPLRFPDGREELSGIDKRAVSGPVVVAAEGLVGDMQVDRRFHGGVDRAVYAYAREDADHWVEALGREIPPGLLGENLCTADLDVSGARIGERWRTSRGVVLEVTAPRMPCRTLQGFLDVPDMMARFNSAGRPGAYLRVIVGGEIAAGDGLEIERDALAEAAPTVADIMRWRHGRIATQDAARLAALDPLAADLRAWATELLAER
jgi:MOSC domain-containing protein YiiM